MILEATNPKALPIVYPRPEPIQGLITEIGKVLGRAMSRPADLGSLKIGSYIIIDGEPCKVVEVEKSKPGKHGSAKVRLTAIAVFTGSKKTYIGTVDTHIEVPMIDKRAAQVISVTPASVQLMDLQSFEVTESPIPTEPEFEGKLQPGAEAEVWVVLGKSKIMRVKGPG